MDGAIDSRSRRITSQISPLSPQPRESRFAIAAALLCAAVCVADTRSVPADYATIQSAIDVSADNDEIIVASGTYREAINLLGKAINLHSSDGPATTTIDATDLHAPAVTCINNETAASVLAGFSITGGQGHMFDGTLQAIGGGMRISEASPTVTDCIFTHNSLHGYGIDAGGGIYIVRGSPLIRDCIFEENVAGPTDELGQGGGIYVYGGAPLITNCRFTGNRAAYSGGGICVESGEAVIDGCLFEENEAAFGGGVDANDRTHVTNCTFIENSAGSEPFGGGGAIDCGGGTLIANCIIRRNSAWANDERALGGAVMCWGNAMLINCIIADNVCHGVGGGIYSDGGAPHIINCTIHGNSAVGEHGSGGGIFNFDGTTRVASTVIWGNSPDELSGELDVTYSDVQRGYTGIGNINADPLFIDPDNADFHLAADSPCIDVGNNDSIPSGITRDLDGRVRIWDGNNDGVATVDMGAYEFASRLYADMNCDGAVNFNDIDAFVTALIGRPEYEHDYPGCNYALADINADGAVDFNDIDPFVDCLINNGCP